MLFFGFVHFVKTGAGVVYKLFEILPKLRSGVVVHSMISF